MKIVKINQVIDITKLSRSTIYSKMSKNEFPKPIKLGERQ